MICDLLDGEARAMEVHGKTPDCTHHRHLKPREARERVESGVARWAGHGERRIVACEPKVWAVKWSSDRSANYRGWQMVNVGGRR